MCAASNRSRERENKNENRDVYLREKDYHRLPFNLLTKYEQTVTELLNLKNSLRNTLKKCNLLYKRGTMIKRLLTDLYKL